jgi:hypothetical protein
MIKPSQFQWNNVGQITPSFIAGIILIILLVNDLNRPKDLPPLISSSVYVEYLLSFIASFMLLYLVLTPFYYDLIRVNSPNTTVNPSGYFLYIMYAFVASILSPFGLLSIRFFLQDETYVKYISMTTIVSTLLVLYFTFRAAFFP